MRKMARLLSLVSLAATLTTGALAEDVLTPEGAKADIKATMGAVPTFIGAIADSALPGLWQQEKMLEMSDKTALSPKEKALISLAVASQIPCTYCIWSDTNSARQFGATDQEIAEAVAMAGLTRNMSTILNGMQVDFDTFKKELGGQ